MIGDGLANYLLTLVPSAYDRNIVSTRKTEIVAQLERSGLGVVTSFEAGSFSHGTGVKGFVDVDLMVWLKYDHRTSLPSSTLAKVRSSLDGLTNKRSVATSSPTVQLMYWTPPHFEVVPAFYRDKTPAGVYIYDIPGRRDEWIQSAPKAHNAYVDRQNDLLSKRVKNVVRLAKAWKYGHGVPVSSFYLEMRVAEFAEGQSSIFYHLDLRAIFDRMSAWTMRDMRDPEEIAGNIPAVSSEANRLVATSLVTSAAADLRRAYYYREMDDRWNYLIAMQKVFPDFRYGMIP